MGKLPAREATPSVDLDDGRRKRILRGIWITKLWIAVLAICLPIGIAIGILHRAWLPTVTGATINLLLMYAAIKHIRMRRMLIDQAR